MSEGRDALLLMAARVVSIALEEAPRVLRNRFNAQQPYFASFDAPGVPR